MKRNPSFMLDRIESPVFWGRNRMVRIDSEMIGAKKDRPLRPKHQALPSLTKAMPPKVGPMMVARLNWMELSAMALGMSSLRTRVGISAE